MRVSYLVVLFPLGTLAAINGRCTGSKATGTWGSSGICLRTSTCAEYGGATKNDACPFDADNVKCCLVGLGPDGDSNPCGGLSYCDWTSNVCDGRRLSDKCPGGDNYKCCRRTGTK